MTKPDPLARVPEAIGQGVMSDKKSAIDLHHLWACDDTPGRLDEPLGHCDGVRRRQPVVKLQLAQDLPDNEPDDKPRDLEH